MITALLWAFGQALLGGDFDARTREAWRLALAAKPPSCNSVLLRRNDRIRRHPAPVLDERRYWIMTLRQIELVQQSFRLIQPIIDDVAMLFYKRLFEIDPSLRHMFHRPRREQARLLAQMVSLVVKQIDRPSRLRRAVEAWGQRHVGYGVRDEHYATVGEALVWTLEKGLKDAFTSEVRNAWVVAYSWLAFTMQRAAARHADAGPAPSARCEPRDG